MKKIIVRDYEALSEQASALFIQEIRRNPRLVLGLATGSTPIGLYQKLIEAVRKRQISFQEATTFNLDEYIGLAPDHPQSYRYFMQEQLFGHIDIDPAHIHIPSGQASDLIQECQNYEQAIEESGGIDLMLLGVGENGHIAFNEPAQAASAFTHAVELSPDTLEVNARFFKDSSQVPKKALSMGIGTILQSRKIVLLISGSAKKETARRFLESNVITPAFPVSFLLGHPDVTVILDEEASGR